MLDFQIPRITAESVEDNRGQFVVEPLDRGFGYTFGNSLRRWLLSSLAGAAVTSVRVEGVAHEFSTITGETLLRMLETRLDNVVYRLGFAASRAQARQLVRHGHFAVNGRRVNIPSYQVKPDDVITVKAGSSAEQTVRDATDLTASVAPWLQADHDGLTGKILKWPDRGEIDTPVQESLIVELYSK